MSGAPVVRTELVPRRVAIKVNGAELSPEVHEAIVDLRVVNGFGVPDYARIEFRVSASGDGLDADRITTTMGNAVEIKVDDGDAPWTIFDGLVVGLGLEVDTGTSQHVVVECYDKLYKLGRTSMAATHQRMKVGDIASRFAQDIGLGISGTSALPQDVFEARYQYGTRYAFLDRLIRDAGCEWRVHDSTLTISKRAPGATHRLSVGDNLIAFRSRWSAAEHVSEVRVTGWDPKTKQEIVGVADTADPVSAIGLDNTRVDQGVAGTLAMSVVRPVSTQSEANSLAKGILQRRVGEMLRARGEMIPAAGVVPGTVLEVAGLGSNWTGSYYCTSVEYTFGRQPLRMFFDVGPSEPESLVDILGDTAGPSLDRVLGALTIGIVTNNNDPDGMNRVRVKLPYLSNDVETGWARIAQAGSGANRGWNVLPEIGDEVLVGFEHGDIDRPVVLGGLLNGRDTAKFAKEQLVESGKVIARTFHSRLGHEIVVSDGSDAATQYIQLRTHDSKVVLKLAGDKVELIAKDIPITVKNDKAMLEFDASGNITLKGQKITIQAQQDLSIQGLNVNSKSNANTKIEASANLDAKAGGMANIQGSMTAIKGTPVQLN